VIDENDNGSMDEMGGIPYISKKQPLPSLTQRNEMIFKAGNELS
jgi:hypothetical protein